MSPSGQSDRKQGKPLAAPAPANVTQLLQAWSRGDSSALKKLTPLVYKELHRLARRYMSFENPGHTLQTTALVNEAYVRLVSNRANWQNRAHFFAISAQLMRQILVDFARSRHQWKRGGKVQRVSLDEATVSSEEAGVELVALDDALKALAEVDPRKSQVVELRFFGGLSFRGDRRGTEGVSGHGSAGLAACPTVAIT